MNLGDQQMSNQTLDQPCHELILLLLDDDVVGCAVPVNAAVPILTDLLARATHAGVGDWVTVSRWVTLKHTLLASLSVVSDLSPDESFSTY